MFHVGQQVVFIGPDFRSHPYIILGRTNVPVPDQVYTIRSPRLFYRGVPGYLLVEVVNTIRPPLVQEMIIDETMLRPLVATKQEISFTTGADPSTRKYDNRRKRKVTA